MNSSIRERVIRGRMTWAGNVERMDGGRLPKMAMSHLEGGRRGRPHLRWKDCVEREFRRAGGNSDWRVRVMDRERWRALVNDAAVS